MDRLRIDWPLAGALTGVIILASAATYAAVTLAWPHPEPPKKAPKFVNLGLPAERLTGFTLSSAPDVQWDTSRPFILSDTSKNNELLQTPVIESLQTQRPVIESIGKKASLIEPMGKKAPVIESVSKPPLPERKNVARENAPFAINAGPSPQNVEKWKVTASSKANAFNLGGHINHAGVVDDMANSHLRDAFRAHKNYRKLPPQIRMHIETQNIDLCKIAPYRALLGVDDKKIEEEQGVRFERIATSR